MHQKSIYIKPYQTKLSNPKLFMINYSKSTKIHFTKLIRHSIKAEISKINAKNEVRTIEYKLASPEYVLELKNPLGISLAPDLNGQIYVVKIHPGGNASKLKMIQEGDILKKCTNGIRHELRNYTDLRKIQWAINNSKDKVKLVFERRQIFDMVIWHPKSKNGQCSSVYSWLIYPVHLTEDGKKDCWARSGEGKSLASTFHKAVVIDDEEDKKISRRKKSASDFRSALLLALRMPCLVLPMYPAPQALYDENDRFKNEDVSSTLTDTNKIKRKKDKHLTQNLELPTKKIVPVMPWLQVSTAQLTHSDLTEIASQSALQGLLELRLQQCNGWASIIGTCRSTNSGIHNFVIAVATLHRLVLRRRNLLKNGFESCHIIIHCDEGMMLAVASLIAAYCHWFGLLTLEESISIAELAIGTRISRARLQDATNFLYKQSLDRQSCVTVTWPHGGGRVEVAGELVGGWDHCLTLVKAPPTFSPCLNVPPNAHYLRLTGLDPGIYHYKFIVDGRWTLDRQALQDSDANGNRNNVLLVKKKNQRFGELDKTYVYRVEARIIASRIKLQN